MSPDSKKQEETEVIVVSVAKSHPTGSRNRAGFRFTAAPVAIQVTETEREEIESDEYLKVYSRGDVYDKAVSKLNGEDAPRSPNTPVEGTGMTQSQIDAEVARRNEISFGAGDSVKGNKAKVSDSANTGEGDDGADTGDTKTKAEIIEALKAQGLKEGEDFDPNAKKADLSALLS